MVWTLNVPEMLNRPVYRFLASLSDIFVIIAIVLVYFAVSSFKHQQRMALIHQPLVNDFYLVDYYQIDPTSDRKYRYLPIKITEVSEHSISYQPGNSGHSKPVGINDHFKFDAPMHYNYFKHREFTVSRAEFDNWGKTGVIYDIARPEKFYINGWIVLSPAEVIRGNKLNAEQVK